MAKDEFKRDVEIDPNELDLACTTQAEIFFKWAERLVISRNRVDRLKKQLETKYASISSDIRQNPESFGMGKSRVTESSIDATIRTDPDYAELYDDWLKARYNMNMLDMAVKAMEQRKRMIEVLVTLHGQEYFAGPSIPRNLGEAWVKRRKQTEQDVNELLRKNARRRTRK